MHEKRLVNKLKLAYTPLTAYEFSIVKKDKVIIEILENASLYILAQRRVLYFKNISINEDTDSLMLEIHQEGNTSFIGVQIPFRQTLFNNTKGENIYIGFISFEDDERKRGLLFEKMLESGKEFIAWFSPDKLLNNWKNGFIDCLIEGDFTEFMSYKVHYVGKATRQGIFSRLKGHETLQDILSRELPFEEGQLPKDEIVILPFEFEENVMLQTFNHESDVDVMVNALFGKYDPSEEKVFLDAEKALVKAMTPKYNNILFKNYPKSNDGLYSDNYDCVSYTFKDPITLVYSDGEIRGGLDAFGGDLLLIKNNTSFELLKR